MNGVLFKSTVEYIANWYQYAIDGY